MDIVYKYKKGQKFPYFKMLDYKNRMYTREEIISNFPIILDIEKNSDKIISSILENPRINFIKENTYILQIECNRNSNIANVTITDDNYNFKVSLNKNLEIEKMDDCLIERGGGKFVYIGESLDV